MIIDETERLVIREFCMNDAEQLYRLISETPEALDENLRGISYEDFIPYLHSYIKYQYGFYGYGLWGLFQKDKPASESLLLGIAGVTNDDESGVGKLSWSVSSEFRRRGYALEACRAIIDCSLEDIGFKRLTAHIRRDNLPSVALAQKLNIQIIFEE